MPGPVIIVDYDPRWPVLYEEEKTRILRTVGHRILAVEHIGSTAVPGLGAKPIIDMMAGVRSSADAEECVPLLGEIGYADVTRQPDTPGWYYCLGKSPHSTGYHLHLVKFMSDHWMKHLLFRDYLRTHPEVAEQYHGLKKELSARYGTNRIGYTEAKTPFIESVILCARQEIS